MNGRERVKGALEHKPIDRIPFYCDELFVDAERRWLDEGLPATQAEREDLFDYDFTEMFIDFSIRFEPGLIDEIEETMTVADKYGFIDLNIKTYRVSTAGNQSFFEHASLSHSFVQPSYAGTII